MSEIEDQRHARIAASWESNADAWTAAVRAGRIESRRRGTDAAVLAAVGRRPPGRVLDLGCGEGWLARALDPRGYRVTGLDGSAALVERARALGGGEFRVASYEAVVAEPALAGGPFDTVVLNFALLAEAVVPLLSAAGRLLAPTGVLVLQTVHPWVAAGEGPYRDGWRLETFDAFGGAFPEPMPWYFRTLASWMEVLRAAGLAVVQLEEPADPETGRPLSLLFTCAPAVGVAALRAEVAGPRTTGPADG